MEVGNSSKLQTRGPEALASAQCGVKVLIECQGWDPCSNEHLECEPGAADSEYRYFGCHVLDIHARHLVRPSRGGASCEGCPQKLHSVLSRPAVGGGGVQNTPAWYKNYFQQMPYEFLKSLICLKVEASQKK